MDHCGKKGSWKHEEILEVLIVFHVQVRMLIFYIVFNLKKKVLNNLTYFYLKGIHSS